MARWWNRWRWRPFWGSYYYPLTSPTYIAASIGPEIAAQARADERAKLQGQKAQMAVALQETEQKNLQDAQKTQLLLGTFGIVSFVLVLTVIYLATR
jgi:hypothetical protein